MAERTRRIGQEIRRQRRKQDLSLSQLAERAGVSKSYLWKLENGDAEARPSGQTLYKIARAFGTSMSSLIGREVLVDEPHSVPRSLAKFAKDEGLGERDVQMLAQINFRGRQPERPEDWQFIWRAIQRSVPHRLIRKPASKSSTRAK